MKVLFDHTIFQQRYGGASKYFTEIMKRFPPQAYKLSLLLCNNTYLAEASICREAGFRHFIINRFPQAYRVNSLVTLWQLQRGRYDIYHPTGYGPKWDMVPNGKKVVVTFHDLTIFKFPQYFNKVYRELYIRQQRTAAERADCIIAISNHTKKDLIETFGTNPYKIKVVYHGVEKKKLRRRRLHENPYVLFVGARNGYKNFIKCIEAFGIIHSKYPELHLICTGLPFTLEEHKLLMQLGLWNSVFCMSATEAQMDALYQFAELFIYPSLYEGFGMPILEAMCNGCPVALSDASCFPEIAGEGGKYFDPTSSEEIANVMEQILTSNTMRQNMIQSGYRRIQYFSWEKCAHEHLQLYQSLI